MRGIWWMLDRGAVLGLGVVTGLALARAIWPAAAQQPATPSDRTVSLIYAIQALSVDTARLADSMSDLRDRMEALEHRVAGVESRGAASPAR